MYIVADVEFSGEIEHGLPECSPFLPSQVVFQGDRCQARNRDVLVSAIVLVCFARLSGMLTVILMATFLSFKWSLYSYIMSLTCSVSTVKQANLSSDALEVFSAATAARRPQNN